jgi:hypothetical protein
MKISISGIYNRGDITNERVHFRADTDIDLSFFVLFDTAFMVGTQVSAGNHGAFWFGPRAIPRGDHVVVYTRVGNPSTEKKDGVTYHFLFRGWDVPLYTEVNRCAAIMELATWAATPTNALALPPLPSPAYPISHVGVANIFEGQDRSGGALSLSELLGSLKPKP